MEHLLDLISAEVKKAFTDAGYDGGYGRVQLSDRPDLCEFQCNGAMAAAKEYKKAPFLISECVAGELSGNGMFASAESARPGFLNLKISEEFLAGYLNEMRKGERFGAQASGHGENIIVDYGGANVAKPLHVGHLRSAVIGECVRRMGLFLGHHMVGDVHLGDWGLQMGLIIEELRDRQPSLVYFDEDYTGDYPSKAPFTLAELEEIYPAASKKSKDDASFLARAQETTRRLQDGHPPYRAIWDHIMQLSVADLKKNYDALDVHFDLWKGESDAQERIPDLITDLLERGIARESAGALVVDIAQESDAKELPPCIVRKSDGAALYATSDLATILQREEDYAPTAYIYLADKRQKLHFTQVFRVAKRAGYVSPKTEMTHIGFGTMNGKDGRPFKTRDGGVMRLEQLVADIEEAVYERIAKGRSVGGEEARETAGMVALAALKYGDLSNQASKDYVFDLERFISFEGNTGPYLLYTIVRIKSILRKYAEAGGETGGVPILPAGDGVEKDLMLQLAQFGAVVENAFSELAPHRLCAWLYELADAFNSFYHRTKILAEEDTRAQAGHIRLLGLTKDVLETGISLLGFSAPERM